MAGNVDVLAYAPRLVEVEPGLFAGRGEVGGVSYPTRGNETCFALEDGSFWFRHRNACIETIVRRFPPGGPIFDVGGGNGYVARGLVEAGFPTVVVEPGAEGVRNALARGLSPVIHAVHETAGFLPHSLPAVGLFDVIEHVEDDVGLLERLAVSLRPGGRLYLTTPAHRWLWSDEDVLAGHHRRYTARSLVRILTRAGYEVEYLTYLFGCLVLPILALRSLPSLMHLRDATAPRRAEHESSGVGGRLVGRLLRRERVRLATGRKRMGASLLVVARAPQRGSLPRPSPPRSR